MRKVLVLGGTRFFGKRLVKRLLQNAENEVTIVTRGQARDDFGSRINRLQADRSRPEELAKAVGQGDWDIVYDNICYSPDDAAAACAIFKDRVGRYILTSSMSVYDAAPHRLTEEDFNPYYYPLSLGARGDFTYQEGKRLAEAVFFKKASFPVTAVRFPIVLGEDDYTNRLQFHIEHIVRNEPVGIPNPAAQISLIRSDEAAEFLDWLGSSSVSGPVNACSGGERSIGEIMALIEQETGHAALILPETSEEHMSPFGIEDSWIMDTTKARSAGFEFLELPVWLPELIIVLKQKIQQT